MKDPVFVTQLHDRRVYLLHVDGTFSNPLPQAIFELKRQRAGKKVAEAMILLASRDGRRRWTPEERAAQQFLKPLFEDIAEEEGLPL